MIKTDEERLKTIVTTWEELKLQIEKNNITKDGLLTNRFFQWAVTTPIYNIGEQVYNLSAELKNRYPNIGWSVVSGLRHRLVHDYDGINWSIIVEVIFVDMDDFVNKIRDVLSEIES